MTPVTGSRGLGGLSRRVSTGCSGHLLTPDPTASRHHSLRAVVLSDLCLLCGGRSLEGGAPGSEPVTFSGLLPGPAALRVLALTWWLVLASWTLQEF